MHGVIVNNSGDSIKVYAMRTNDTSGGNQPNLQDISSGLVPVVSAGSSSDIPLLGQGNYIYSGVWSASASKGTPDSWVVFENDHQPTGSQYNKYAMSVSKAEGTGFMITVSDGVGRSPDTTSSVTSTSTKNTTMWIIILVIVFVLILILMGVGMYMLRPKKSVVNNPFAQTDIPLVQ